MGTLWYMVSLERKMKLELGKPSENVSVGDVILMAGLEGLQIINEHHKLANDHDANGSCTLHFLMDVRRMDKSVLRCDYAGHSCSCEGFRPTERCKDLCKCGHYRSQHHR